MLLPCSMFVARCLADCAVWGGALCLVCGVVAFGVALGLGLVARKKRASLEPSWFSISPLPLRVGEEALGGANRALSRLRTSTVTSSSISLGSKPPPSGKPGLDGLVGSAGSPCLRSMPLASLTRQRGSSRCFLTAARSGASGCAWEIGRPWALCRGSVPARSAVPRMVPPDSHPVPALVRFGL